MGSVDRPGIAVQRTPVQIWDSLGPSKIYTSDPIYGRSVKITSRSEGRRWSDYVRRSQVDWKGWVTLAWVIFWGGVYCSMAVRARGQRVLDWFRPRQAQVSKLATMSGQNQEPDRLAAPSGSTAHR